MRTLFTGEVFADYFQFYLERHPIAPDDLLPWTDEIVRRRMHLEPGRLTISTARNMTVPVSVVLHEGTPLLELDAVDHAVEGGIRTEGFLDLLGMHDQPVRLTVPAGPVRVLAVFTGLGTLSEDGLDGEDRYDLHLWPGEGEDIVVRRQWEGD